MRTLGAVAGYLLVVLVALYFAGHVGLYIIGGVR